MTTKTGIIFIQREKFQIYSPYLPSMFEFRFIPDVVRDYDVMNRELLENLLKVFVVSNKIPVSNMVIVLSDSASFIKDFVLPSTPKPNPQQAASQQAPAMPTLEDLQKQADQFIEHVPFDSVSGKTYPLPNGVKAYATNKEMYESIRSVLEKQGFIIESVIPGFAFGPEVSTKQGLDGSSINIVLQKINMVKAFNMLSEIRSAVDNSNKEEVVEKSSTSSEVTTPPEKQNKKIVILVAVVLFLVLIGITGWILSSQFSERPYVPPPVVSQPTSVPVPFQTTVITPAVLNASNLTVQIVSSSSLTPTAEALALEISKYGFKSVIPVTQEGTNTSTGLLIFSEKTGAEVKNTITQEVKKVAPSIVVQEKPGSAFDVIIILGT